MTHSFEFSLNTHRTHIGNCYDLYVIHSSHILHSFYACFQICLKLDHYDRDSHVSLWC